MAAAHSSPEVGKERPVQGNLSKCELIQEQQTGLLSVVKDHTLTGMDMDIAIQASLINPGGQHPTIQDRHTHAITVKDQAEHIFHGYSLGRSDQRTCVIHIGRSHFHGVPGVNALPVCQ